MLRTGLDGLDIAVSSAGTGALAGDPMDDRAAAYSRQYGGYPDRHVARQLTIEQLRDTDLVLALSREHRRAVVELLPRASHFTFTLREFARLLDTLNVDDRAEIAAQLGVYARIGTLVEIAAANRGVAERPDDPADEDVVDPFRRDDAVYAESVRQLVPAVQSIVQSVLRSADGFQ
ncbi:low molecular weight phosphatase family protein [Diaminobutyricibacter sp. McL0608]|uniref:arsenate reductase/protein-tyrosine-phosphatase family protein n=1 Tax=Leifsonia sp. McL0608 TaxID=3143537 RepID=UPI0031F3179A